MSYSKFSLTQVVEQFHLSYEKKFLFHDITLIAPTEALTAWLEQGLDLALPNGSELARQNYLVTPILLELRRRNHNEIAIYSGTNLNANSKLGLNGECDFIISLSQVTDFLTAPIMTIVEAERNDLEVGIGQCSAQMIGAQIFNQKKGHPIDPIYGCVTTGAQWQFLKLSQTSLTVDAHLYFIGDVPKILGVLQSIVDSLHGDKQTKEAN